MNENSQRTRLNGNILKQFCTYHVQYKVDLTMLTAHHSVSFASCSAMKCKNVYSSPCRYSPGSSKRRSGSWKQYYNLNHNHKIWNIDVLRNHFELRGTLNLRQIIRNLCISIVPKRGRKAGTNFVRLQNTRGDGLPGPSHRNQDRLSKKWAIANPIMKNQKGCWGLDYIEMSHCAIMRSE